MAEIAVLISLFAVGLKLGVPMFDRRWVLPCVLAFPAMALTVALIAVVGVWGLGLSPGEAVLLGGILAPTDPVLASGVQSGARLAARPGALQPWPGRARSTMGRPFPSCCWASG